jgi:hypothetical protein
MKYSFTRACLLRQARKCKFEGGLSHIKCDNLITTYLERMLTQFKLALISYPRLRKVFSPIYNDVYNCPVPDYASKTNNNQKKEGYYRPCSRRRFCPYCWTKRSCLFLESTVNKFFLPGYYLYYTQDVIKVPDSTSLSDLRNLGIGMLKKYRSSYLNKHKVSGVAECLVAYKNKRISSYVFILRRIVYCHNSSVLAVGQKSNRKYGRTSLLFCSFPIGMILQSPVASMKLAWAFMGRKLTRKFGTF